MPDQPRLLRPIGAPLGLYLRPARNDHTELLSLLAENRADLTGLVLDGCLRDRHAELRAEAHQHGLETVLDPRSVELATPGGIARSGVTQLPWAGTEVPHSADILSGSAGEQMVEAIAAHAAENKLDAVLAPTHYLVGGALDPWARVDGELTKQLRTKLDEGMQRDTRIYFPLAVSATVFRSAAQRRALIRALSALPIDAVWLRVHPFGTTSSGPLALRRYIEACRDFHSLGIPLVAERTGTVGIALLAFGAVGGIESGITLGERYDVNALMKPPRADDTPFSPPPRVYIADLGAFLSRDQAIELFKNRQMKALFACQMPACCERGSIDMTGNPKRHFILRRAAEVSRYGRAPEPLRSGLYLEEFLRPATDLALRATRVVPELESSRRRLEGWRNTLGALQKHGPPTSIAQPPQGQRVQPRRPAVGE